MNNTVSNKKAVLALSLAALVSGVSSNVHADNFASAPVVTATSLFTGLFVYDAYNDNSAFTLKKLCRNTAAAAALATCVRYFTKESVTEDKYAEKGNVKKLADIKNMNTKEYWQNFLTVVDEKVVGQRPKDGKIKVEQKGDKLALGGEISPRKPGKGLMGKTEEFAKPFSDAAASAATIVAVMFASNKSETLKNHFANKFGFNVLKDATQSN